LRAGLLSILFLSLSLSLLSDCVRAGLLSILSLFLPPPLSEALAREVAAEPDVLHASAVVSS
jgi:hypothetical protein